MGVIRVCILGLYWDNGKENRNYYNGLYRVLYWGYIGILEKKIETTIMGYIGYILGFIQIMEKKMETTRQTELRLNRISQPPQVVP